MILSKKYIKFKLTTLLFVFVFCTNFTASAQTVNSHLSSYILEHKVDVEKVNNILEEISAVLEEQECSEKRFAAAVIYPELMRYSEFRNIIEAATTQLMYSSGVDYLNFSIGYMQMRPEFCVKVEKYVSKNELLRKKYKSIDFEGKEDTVSSRFQRVLRMKNLETQCVYLMAFIEMCDSIYSLMGKDDLYRLKIISTAYNCGTDYSIEQLEYISNIPAFPFGTNESRSKWKYFELSKDFYTELD